VAKRQLLWGVTIVAFIAVAAAIVVSAFVFRAYVYQAYRVSSAAMSPTLLAGDSVLVDKGARDIDTLTRRDVVVVESPVSPSSPFIERIIGLPGDTVEIIDKQLFVNGVKQDEGYAIRDGTHLYAKGNPRDNYGPKTVPEGQLFVLGDNRDRSHDSRFWGFAEVKKVKGKVAFIYWSWDRESSQVRWERIGQEVL